VKIHILDLWNFGLVVKKTVWKIGLLLARQCACKNNAELKLIRVNADKKCLPGSVITDVVEDMAPRRNKKLNFLVVSV